MVIAFNIDAKEEPQLSQILDCKLGVQASKNRMKMCRARTGDHHVIHVEKIGDICTASKNEERGVGSRRSEADGDDKLGELVKPSSRSLTEPIERLNEETDDVGTIGVNKPDGLLVKNMFLQPAMEEGIRDIQLPCRPLVARSDDQHRPNCGWLDNQRKGFAEIDAGTLREPVYHPVRFYNDQEIHQGEVCV